MFPPEPLHAGIKASDLGVRLVSRGVGGRAPQSVVVHTPSPSHTIPRTIQIHLEHIEEQDALISSPRGEMHVRLLKLWPVAVPEKIQKGEQTNTQFLQL